MEGMKESEGAQRLEVSEGAISGTANVAGRNVGFECRWSALEERRKKKKGRRALPIARQHRGLHPGWHQVVMVEEAPVRLATAVVGVSWVGWEAP